jgi:cellulose synthase/poly-beta-1,6-N-acetylglucosamine synthase-like glycosyltransferase
MFWVILISLLLAALGVYLYYLQLFSRGLKNRATQLKNVKPKISVVIAARNEEDTLPRLLTALINQSYPQDFYEVIVANDQSTDKTAAIVEEFSRKWPQIKLLNVKNRRQVPSPKKNALQQAIEMAQNEIILSTDADCLVGKYWIEAMASEYADPEVKMVCGFSKTNPGSWQKISAVQKFEHFDFIAIFSAAAGALGSGKYFSCSGQNISYRQADFWDVGGFSKIWQLISGDDVNLLQLFRQADKKVRFCLNHHSYATTRAIDSWSELLNQRSRWASNMKWQLQLNPEFFLYLTSAYLLTIFVYLLWLVNWWLPLGFILLRMGLELSFLKQAFQIFRIEKNILKFYPLWFFIQPFYMLAISFLGALNIFAWKK